MISISEDLYKFLQDNSNRDILDLKLKLSSHNLNFDLDFALTQIDCRRKYNGKLKSLLQNPRFLFPDSISGEQASHQSVARYHASLISDSNSSVLDMTAGLGSDAFSFASSGLNVTAVELDKNKAEVLDYNAKISSLSDFKVINEDCLAYLSSSPQNFDVIFIDPARRSSVNKRLYNLHDCLPDVVSNQKLLAGKASVIFIKASPMLDITQTLKDFDDIKSIRAIGVKGECKEVLVEIRPDRSSMENGSGITFGEDSSERNKDILIEAVNLDNDGNILNSFLTTFNNELPTHTDPESKSLNFASEEDLQEGSFLLEPSSMIMKISPWNEICRRFQAKKFAPSSHLFITQTPPFEFPGRVSVIRRILKKNDRKSLTGFPATVVSKNHPLSSEELRKSLKIKEGDNNFIYASRLGSKTVLILTESLKSETCR